MNNRNPAYNIMMKILIIITFLLPVIHGFSQDSILVKFYINSESGKEYIQNAKFYAFNESKNSTDSLTADEYGFLKKKLARNEKYRVRIAARLYEDTVFVLELKKINESEIFEKIKLKPATGYLFEISLTDYNPTNEKQIDGITDAVIQVYDDKAGIIVEDFKNAFPYFKLLLKDSSSYTILITKTGYFSKILNVKINTESCVLCFDGVKKLRESRSEDMSRNNPFFNAEIELEKFDPSKIFIFRDIFFEDGSTSFNESSKTHLSRIWKILNYNPGISFELSSHTDSRGSETLNLELSQQRLNMIIQILKLDKKLKNYFPVAYGEAKISNKCKNNIKCSDEEHLHNRRFELKPIGLISEENVAKISLLGLLEEEKNIFVGKEAFFDNETIDTMRKKSSEAIKQDIHVMQKSETENKGKFKIIAGSFKNADYTQNIKNQLTGMGINVSFELDDTRKLTKVIAGKYKTENEARDVMTKLRNAGIECYLSQ